MDKIMFCPVGADEKTDKIMFCLIGGEGWSTPTPAIPFMDQRFIHMGTMLAIFVGTVSRRYTMRGLSMDSTPLEYVPLPFQ